MSFGKIIILITLISINNSFSFHVDISVQTPSGHWNVVAVRGYSDLLPIPKCWTIDVSESTHGRISGSSSLYYRNTNEYFQVIFRGERYAGYKDPLYGMHHYELNVTFGEDEPIYIRTVSFVYIQNDKVAARVSNFGLKDGAWDYLDMLYISRESHLPDNYTVGDAMIIDNMNCE